MCEQFFVNNVHLLKEYTHDNIKNIDKSKSNCFWDSICSYINTYDDPDVRKLLPSSALKIYDYYEKKCELLDETIYPKIELLIDKMIEKYNEFMELSEDGLNIKQTVYEIEEEQERGRQEERDSIKKHTSTMSIINIVIPGILLAPIATLLFSEAYLAVVLGIIDIIWLGFGISAKSNSCSKCGKWNSYKNIDEEILDRYVTTKVKYDRNNRPYDAPVTKEEVLITLKCSNCGHIEYRKKEREV